MALEATGKMARPALFSGGGVEFGGLDFGARIGGDLEFGGSAGIASEAFGALRRGDPFAGLSFGPEGIQAEIEAERAAEPDPGTVVTGEELPSEEQPGLIEEIIGGIGVFFGNIFGPSPPDVPLPPGGILLPPAPVPGGDVVVQPAPSPEGETRVPPPIVFIPPGGESGPRTPPLPPRFPEDLSTIPIDRCPPGTTTIRDAEGFPAFCVPGLPEFEVPEFRPPIIVQAPPAVTPGGAVAAGPCQFFQVDRPRLQVVCCCPRTRPCGCGCG